MARPNGSSGHAVGAEHAGDRPWRAGGDARSSRRHRSAGHAVVHADDPVAVEDRQRLGIARRISAPASSAASISAASRRRRGHTAPWAGNRSVAGQSSSRRCRAGDHPQPVDAMRVGHVDRRARSSAPTARGVRPSPQTLSRPYGALLEHDHRAPARAARIAAAAPAGPPPITARSTDRVAVTSAPPCGHHSVVSLQVETLLHGARMPTENHPASPHPGRNGPVSCETRDDGVGRVQRDTRI